jgi:Caspase domain
MPASKQKPFPQLLEKFKKSMTGKKVVKQPRLILIIMANTHDAELNTACEKDAAAVRKVFADICKHIHYDLFTIEIAGSNYNRYNLELAVDSIVLYNENDVTLFYYSGHGFSYEKDHLRKYPQVDMRAHNDQKKYNKINFIEKHTENLAAILSIMRFKGARINIAIGDCCNTKIPFKRPPDSEKDMNIVKGIMPHKSKALTKKMFTDAKNAVCILVSSSQHGQPAVTDAAIGSIFTHHFTRALASTISNEPKGSQYLPWLKLLKQTASQAFKDSKGYDIGGGKAGKQKAVFEVFIDRE